MLKSKSVAKLIENLLNQNDKQEHFRVVYEVGSYKGTAINCIFKQGKGTITPIANYTNVRTPYSLEVIMSTQCGEDRIDSVIDIINDMIYQLNGKVKDIDKGKAVFLISPLEIGNYETRATVGQSIIIKVDFSVEYSTSSGTKYEMTLINTQFDDGSINTRYFKTREEQIEWFESKIQDEGVGYSEVLTPNINSLVLTSQRFLNSNGLDVNELLLKNYAIIREIKSDGSVKYYYYYVTSSNIGDYNLITVDLKMDSLQTHYIDLQFGDCFINKADFNRWIDNGDGTVSFDTSVDSKLFEREDIKNTSKRMVKRDVLTNFNDKKFGTANTWLDNNVLGWYYIFISSNALVRVPNSSYSDDHGFGVAKLKPLLYKNKTMKENDLLFNYKDNSFRNTIVCCALPLMKTDKKLYFSIVSDKYDENDNLLGWDISDRIKISDYPLEWFIENLGSEYIYALKFSQVPPFKYVDGVCATDNADFVSIKDSLNENNDLHIMGEYATQEFEVDDKKHSYNVIVPRAKYGGHEIEAFSNYGSLGEESYGMLNVLCQVNININMNYKLKDIDFKFKISDIVGADHDLKYNPKLLSSDYMGLMLSDNLQNGAEYDILKLGKNDLDILYTEALTPDITKKYIRFSNLDGYYISEISENLTGYVVTDDTSFVIEGNQYQSMLANNKNFFLQNTINRENNINQTLMSSISTIGSGFVGGLTGGLLGVATSALSLASASMKNNNDIINDNLTIDNLKNAPNSINGAKGNVIFNAMYSDLGVVVEIHDILPHEKKIIDDNINMFGMTLNKVANIKSYDNIRHYHNYIQANIENIIGDISNPIREDIRQRFANGVRFWNDDNIQYEKENYERWLNNE